MIMPLFLRRLRATKGLALFDYALLMSVFVALTVGFVAVSSGVLERGLDTTQRDFAQVDSLDSSVGPVEVSTPVLGLAPGAPASAVQHQPYAFGFGRFLTLPAGVDGASMVWSLQSSKPLPPGFVFDSQTGVLSGTYTGGGMDTFVLTVSVDNGVYRASQTYAWTVREAGLFLRPAVLAALEPDTPYRVSFGAFLEVPDSVAPGSVVWTVESSTLPEALVVAGTPPVVAGTYTGAVPAGGVITLRVDAGPYTARQSYTVSSARLYLRADDGLVLASQAPSFVGFDALLEHDSTVDPLRVEWSLTALDADGLPTVLPEGVGFEGARMTGPIVGLESAQARVRALATYGSWSTTRDYAVRITGRGLALSGAVLEGAPAYTYRSVALGSFLQVATDVDPASVVWSATGDVPPGFVVDPQTGLLTGRLRQSAGGVFAFTVRASLPDGRAASAVFEWSFSAVGGSSPTDLPLARYGVPYQGALGEAVVGHNPTGWQWSVAYLPEGLVVNTATGQITGTPVSLEDRLAADNKPVLLAVEAHDGAGLIDRWTVPLSVDGLFPFRVTSGGDNNCALDERGKAYCWGRGTTAGMVGNAGYLNANATAPVAIQSQPGPFVDIDMSNTTVCAREKSGQIWCWGANTYGQMGAGTTSAGEVAPVAANQASMGLGVTEMSVGQTHTCAISAAAEAWCWGAGNAGRLGTGKKAQELTPAKVVQTTGMTAPIARISAGTTSSCAVDVEGVAWCWGRGDNGRLGDGRIVSVLVPVRVDATEMGPVQDISMGNSHACAVSQAREVWCWGDVSNMLLGAAYEGDQLRPIRVSAPGMGLMDRVVTSQIYTCAYRIGREQDPGAAWCWGQQTNGRLGNGSTVAGFVGPHAVQQSPAEGPLLGVDAGVAAGSGSCAWTATRKAHCWGRAAYGRLGDPAQTSDAGSPVAVAFPAIVP